MMKKPPSAGNAAPGRAGADGMNRTVEIGRVVCSVAGRDRGRLYAVIAAQPDKTDENGVSGYVLAADGRLRRFANPKSKKMKHLRLTRYVFPIADIEIDRRDAALRRFLAECEAAECG